jgi:polysaccharide biosynthesis protein
MKYNLNAIKENKNLLGNMAGTFMIKGLSLLISLYTISAYMHFFPDQKVLGIWLSLQNILNWVLTFDLGIGNGLRNNLVKYIVAKDEVMQKRCVSSAYCIIGVISLILAVFSSIVIRLLNWNSIVNIPAEIVSNDTLVLVVQIMFVGLLIQFFLKLILSILYALQKTALANFLSLLSHSLILIFVIIFQVDDTESGLVVLSCVQTVTVNLPLLVATIVVFAKPLKYARPNPRFFVKSFALDIMKLGYMFLWIQVTLLIINSTNDFLITNLFAPEYVVQYQVYNRIFFMFISMFSIITNPVWSSVSTAYNQNRIGWIKKTYRNLNLLGILVCIGCFTFVPAPILQFVFTIIRTESITVSTQYAFIFALFSSVMIMLYSVTCIANGINKLRPQIIGNTIAAVAKIPLVILLSRIIESWICVVIVNVLIMIPCLIIQVVALHKELRNESVSY